MESGTFPGCRFDAGDESERESKVRASLQSLEGREGPLKCAACGFLITHREAGIAIGGQHARWFTNPSGFSFHIGCFESAPGCSRLGPETAEYSWFPGYTWSIALCAGCGAHLGWRFRSPAHGFYGLILDRLVASPPE